MIADHQEVLNRFHRVLVQEFGSRYPRDLSASLTVADIYYDVVPFQTLRDQLGVASISDYEHALLRLLAGQGGVLEMESLADRQKLQRHLDSRKPDAGFFRDLLAAGVRVCPTSEDKPLARDERKDLPVFQECPSCIEPLPQPAEVNFCPFCGGDLRRVLCVSCDEKLKLGWRFCVACGTEVEPRGGPLTPH
ncbi:MAG: zinc ribbon domain-containing protein [Longimicrobiales bacterium]|nr:zinc ribbon domain-containing protein [Longimicrobiales bacterium]